MKTTGFSQLMCMLEQEQVLVGDDRNLSKDENRIVSSASRQRNSINPRRNG